MLAGWLLCWSTIDLAGGALHCKAVDELAAAVVADPSGRREGNELEAKGKRNWARQRRDETKGCKENQTKQNHHQHTFIDKQLKIQISLHFMSFKPTVSRAHPRGGSILAARRGLSQVQRAGERCGLKLDVVVHHLHRPATSVRARCLSRRSRRSRRSSAKEALERAHAAGNFGVEAGVGRVLGRECRQHGWHGCF